MKAKPLTNAELVKINRLRHEYTEGDLPNKEQIIFDVGWLSALVNRLAEYIERESRR